MMPVFPEVTRHSLTTFLHMMSCIGEDQWTIGIQWFNGFFCNAGLGSVTWLTPGPHHGKQPLRSLSVPSPPYGRF